MRLGFLVILSLLVIITVFLFSLLAVSAREGSNVCCQINNNYGHSTEDKCTGFGGTVVDDDNCPEAEKPGEMVCCRLSPESGDVYDYDWHYEGKCKEVGAVVDDDLCGDLKEANSEYRETIKIKSNYGEVEYKYKYKSEFEGVDEIEVEFEEKNFYFEELKPEFFVMGKMMEGLEEGQFEEFMQSCPDVNAMVDGIISRLESLGKWDVSKACDKLEEEVGNCGERARDGCENIKQGNIFSFGDKKIDCGDEVSRALFYDICLDRKGFSDEEFDVEDRCEEDWERMEENCERRRAYCEQADEEREDTEDDDLDENSGEGVEEFNDDMIREENMMTGMVIYSTSCEIGPMCERENFMNNCAGNSETSREMMGTNCNRMADQMVESFRTGCSHRDGAYNQCIQSTERYCGPLSTTLERCGSINEDDIKTVMIEHGTKMCRMFENKDKYEFIRKMIEARSHFKDKSELQLAFDDQTEDVLDTKEELKNVEDKNFGYKLKKFFGFAAEQERMDAEKLKASAEKLRNTAEFLRDLADSADNEIARDSLLEQADKLEEEADKLEDMANDRIERANGLWSYFG